MMKKVIILPYFGNFPNYFELYLKSCAFNKEYDFLIITDNKEIKTKYENIIIKEMTLSKLNKLINKKLKTKSEIKKPYKLCDYRVAYGKIFEDYIEEYDFWGYCDCDLIFGKINNFIKEECYEKYDKIQMLGHLTLYKNDEYFRNMHKLGKNEELNFYKSINIDEPCFIDEIVTPKLIKNKTEYITNEFSDVLPQYKNFVVNKRSNKEKVDYFEYKNGKVYSVVNGISKETMYVHFQKRKMTVIENLKYNKTIYFYPNIITNSKYTNYKVTNKIMYKIKYYINFIKKFNITRIKIKLINKYKLKVRL